MRSLLVASVCMVALVAACEPTTVAADDDGEGGGGAISSGAGAGGAPASCDVPDTSCPGTLPYPGSPCATGLACTYGDDVIPWNFACVDGRWEGAPDCSTIGGACGIFPESEGCAGPFSGMLDATVEIGPAELGQPFRAFEPDELVDAEWGQQGLAMLHFRVKVAEEIVPDCVLMQRVVAPEAMMALASSRPVQLRCGESLRMYVILPSGDCPEDPVPTTLTVDVVGVGTAEAQVLLTPEAFCGPSG